jgi:hypothetical protein
MPLKQCTLIYFIKKMYSYITRPLRLNNTIRSFHQFYSLSWYRAKTRSVFPVTHNPSQTDQRTPFDSLLVSPYGDHHVDLRQGPHPPRLCSRSIRSDPLLLLWKVNQQQIVENSSWVLPSAGSTIHAPLVADAV